MFPISIYADNVFYCTSDKSIGFRYIDGKWREGGFKQNRHTLKFTDNYSSVESVQRNTDKDYMDCQRNYYSAVRDLETIICTDKRYGSMLIFNKDSLKYSFSSTSPFSFTVQPNDEMKEDRDTSSIEIGSCVKF